MIYQDQAHLEQFGLVSGDLKLTNLNPCGKRYGVDTGNFYYGKIEHHTRQTDPFMSLVASMTIEDLLGDGVPRHTPDIGAFIY